MFAASGRLLAVWVAVSGCSCLGSRCGGLDRAERGQGGCGLCGVVVCSLGLRSLAWVVWLAGVRVLRLAGSRFRELVVDCDAVPYCIGQWELRGL